MLVRAVAGRRTSRVVVVVAPIQRENREKRREERRGAEKRTKRERERIAFRWMEQERRGSSYRGGKKTVGKIRKIRVGERVV